MKKFKTKQIIFIFSTIILSGFSNYQAHSEYQNAIPSTQNMLPNIIKKATPQQATPQQGKQEAMNILDEIYALPIPHGRDNHDIDRIVQKYIKFGMPELEVRKILKSYGFSFNEKSGTTYAYLKKGEAMMTVNPTIIGIQMNFHDGVLFSTPTGNYQAQR